jgi:uncharacterized membrane protein
MVDKKDPLQLKLSTSEKWLAGIVGFIVLVVASFTAVFGAWKEWTINSVAMGALFAVGLVLLVLGVAGRLPATVSVSDKGFALGYVAGAEDTAQKAAEKTKDVAKTTRKMPEQPSIQTAVVAAQDKDQARNTIKSEIVERVVENLPTDPREFLPDATEQMRQIAQGLAGAVPPQ